MWKIGSLWTVHCQCVCVHALPALRLSSVATHWAVAVSPFFSLPPFVLSIMAHCFKAMTHFQSRSYDWLQTDHDVTVKHLTVWCRFQPLSSSISNDTSRGWAIRIAHHVIIIKVFVKCKTLSIETVLSAHTQAFCYTKLNVYSLKLAAKGDSRWMKSAPWNRKHGRSTVSEMNVFRLQLNESREGFCWKGREGGDHSMLMDQKQKRHDNQQWSLVWSIWRQSY